MNYEDAPAERLYDEVVNIELFETVVHKCLQEYNSVSKSTMNLVVFRYT